MEIWNEEIPSPNSLRLSNTRIFLLAVRETPDVARATRSSLSLLANTNSTGMSLSGLCSQSWNILSDSSNYLGEYMKMSTSGLSFLNRWTPSRIQSL